MEKFNVKTFTFLGCQQFSVQIQDISALTPL